MQQDQSISFTTDTDGSRDLPAFSRRAWLLRLWQVQVCWPLQVPWPQVWLPLWQWAVAGAAAADATAGLAGVAAGLAAGFAAAGLFGTAIGAGTLFLPINAGLGGFWPLLILALLAFPMTFYAHRGLTRFVLSGREGSDITDVVEEHFGLKAGAVITLLYFLAIFPILLIYSVALTNTVSSFMLNQLSITPPPRALLSLVLILGLLIVVRCGDADGVVFGPVDRADARRVQLPVVHDRPG